MFNAGVRGFSASRGLLGALRARGPRANLVEELLNMSDAASCPAYVRQSAFLEGVDTGSSTADLERALRTAFMGFARKLLRFLGGPAAGVLETYMLRYGIWNLKALFRGATGGSWNENEDNLYPFAPCYAAARQRAALDTPEKVIAFAEHSPLAKTAAAAFDMYQKGEKDLFLFELALDREYALMLWAAAGKVNLMEGRRLRKKLVGPSLGLHALVWGLWLKSCCNTSSEEAMALLSVPPDIIKPSKYLRFIQSGEVSGIGSALRLGAAGRFLTAEGVPQDVTSWDRLSRRYIWRYLNRRDIGTVFDVTSLIIALMKWEYVVGDMITVVNGRALGLERGDILPLLATQAA